MSIAEGVRVLRGRAPTTNALWSRFAALWWLAGAASFAGYTLLFIALHLHSVGWAPGQVLDPWNGYWRIFYQIIFSEDQVLASRRSTAAALHPLLATTAFVMVGAGFVTTIQILRGAPPDRLPTLGTLIKLALLDSLPLLLLPNLLSGDVYSYISFGRVAVIYGGNPFIQAPSVFHQDPYFQWVNWSHVPSVYGPAWIYPSMALTMLVELVYPTPIGYVLAYKLLAWALHLLNGVLIYAILLRRKPEQRIWGTAFYLLNPLALVEFAGNAHNDVLMISFILASILLHLHGRWLSSVAMLTLAVLTKWIALPLIPLYSLLLVRRFPSWRQRLIHTAGTLVVFAGLTVALYAPYWQGAETLRVLVDAPPQKRLINSIGDMIVHEGQYVMYLLGQWPNPSLGVFTPLAMQPPRYRDVDQADGQLWRNTQRPRLQRYNRQQLALQTEVLEHERMLANIIRFLALALVAIACLVGAMLTRSLQSYLLASAWIFFVYIAIGAVWVWPWYATWFVALAALLDWRVTARTAAVLSLCLLLTYPLFPALPEPSMLVRLRGLLLFGPAIGFAGYQMVGLIRAWRREGHRLKFASAMRQTR